MYVPNLDGRKIPVPCTEIVKPGSQKRIRGEGLPLPKQPHRKGDLIVQFEVIFPDVLLPQQQAILKDVLP